MARPAQPILLAFNFQLSSLILESPTSVTSVASRERRQRFPNCGFEQELTERTEALHGLPEEIALLAEFYDHFANAQAALTSRRQTIMLR